MASGYSRREPEKSLLHRLVRENLETLVAESRSDGGGGLPDFVVRELRDFAKCGLLGEGSLLLRCSKCGQEITVAFSCETKGCPSCVCRRMHSTSLDLVERLPVVPYRHWVLSLPANLRFLLLFGKGLPVPGDGAVRPTALRAGASYSGDPGTELWLLASRMLP